MLLLFTNHIVLFQHSVAMLLYVSVTNSWLISETVHNHLANPEVMGSISLPRRFLRECP